MHESMQRSWNCGCSVGRRRDRTHWQNHTQARPDQASRHFLNNYASYTVTAMTTPTNVRTHHLCIGTCWCVCKPWSTRCRCCVCRMNAMNMWSGERAERVRRCVTGVCPCRPWRARCHYQHVRQSCYAALGGQTFRWIPDRTNPPFHHTNICCASHLCPIFARCGRTVASKVCMPGEISTDSVTPQNSTLPSDIKTRLCSQLHDASRPNCRGQLRANRTRHTSIAYTNNRHCWVSVTVQTGYV
jgi:hypothetical protein